MKAVTIQHILTTGELLIIQVKEVCKNNKGVIYIDLIENIDFNNMSYKEIKKRLSRLAYTQKDKWLQVIIRGCFWVHSRKRSQVYWVDDKYLND